ncbi:oxidoreductase [Pseudokineococcus basanitobsidens]|uniref:Oxidoreductase n=1 Tax=Pseudokineococcus basanitobsidens TaxID=1926649 RepID=A0ABU8RM23_9ACTN
MPARTGTLGSTTVSRVGFGAMQLPGPGVMGPPRDHDEAVAVVRRAVELGVDHVDTASFYGPDVANRLLGEALSPWPQHVALVSKVGARRDEQGAWLAALAPDDIRRSVEDDLRDTGAGRLTAVNLRLHDDTSDEVLRTGLRTLAGLVDEGLVGGVGVSTVDERQLALACDEVDVVCVQNQYGLLDRSGERVLEAAGERGIAYVPYFPLGSAFGAAPRPAEHPTVQRVAADLGVTPSQVALAWLLHHADHVLLIPGTSSLAHLEENVAVRDVVLPDDAVAELDALAPPA